MANHLKEQSESRKWQLMVTAAKEGAMAAGYEMKRVPGRGLSNVWDITKDGKTVRAAIRTTRDRWIAFPPLNEGKNWKTLDDVEMVIVSAVDSKLDPENVHVYLFPADDVRKRFSAAYAARKADGQVQKDNFGVWINLDADTRGIASSVGAGLVADYEMQASYSIKDLLAEKIDESLPAQVDDEVPAVQEAAGPDTIADVMAWARERIAKIAGVASTAVKLELKVEY